MDRIYADARFWTVVVQDNTEGWTGLELYASRPYASHLDKDKRRVAKITFWDAVGQYFLETFGTDVPLEIVEELIAEARATIKVR